ncbi:lipase family protein [Nocardia sp. NPDC005978]|uniref:alpha/beta hydrolase family protein n=1 Tax=Nocardia sp. NPDC005978 TaxID=3156725 RepID=UPI0033A50F54
MSDIEAVRAQRSTRPSPRRRSGFVTATALAAAIVSSPVSARPAAATPVVDDSPDLSFYSAPDDRIPGPPGSIIQIRAVIDDPALPNARNYLLLYRSVDMHGMPVAVSGTVSVPQGSPPPGGWPLISWAHGTTGVADVCAPSLDSSELYPAHDYTALVRRVQARWIAAGYAVAQTDYQGLGTPGPHGYLIGTAEQRAVTDMARAARELEPEIGKRWVAMGHSQGGQAAIFANAQAQEWAPELRLLGAVALAPASHQGVGLQAAQLATVAGIPSAGASLAGESTAFLPLIIRGAQTVADIDPGRFLTAHTTAMVSLADASCIGGLRNPQAWGGLAMNEVFDSEGDMSALTRVLDENDPSALTFTRPLLVLQGRDDTVVPAVATDSLVAKQRLAGQPVQYRGYAGADHRAVLEASYDDALLWVNARFAD